MPRINIQAKSASHDKESPAHVSQPDRGNPGSVATADTSENPEPLVVVETATVPQEEYDRLKTERDLLFDRLARLQAEFDNSRKREAKERAEFRDFAVSNAVEQFLPVLDNFQLALKSTGSAEQLRTGVDLIARQMEEALRSLNVQRVETVGSVFDPRVHEALEMVERNDLPDHQVFEEVRRGYRIRDRLLRPALVRVASNSQQKEA
ncbi:MAG TPA: nucleotide exchange factor GrpE [Acidobacteriaceae bacterium]|jgi:molecular chaperone GrpE|nr:nucleotide exchange factor GrpE [Acidobacteriaceae bacterium]